MVVNLDETLHTQSRPICDATGVGQSRHAWRLLRARRFDEAAEHYFGARLKSIPRSLLKAFSRLLEKVSAQLLLNAEFHHSPDLRSLLRFFATGFLKQPELFGKDLSVIGLDYEDYKVVKSLFAVLKFEVLDRKEFETSLIRLSDMQNPPRKGTKRLAYLYFLQHGLADHGKNLTSVQFESRMYLGQLILQRVFRFNWAYDDAHLRRYMTAFGFAERAADGRIFWRSRKFQDKVYFSSGVDELITELWHPILGEFSSNSEHAINENKVND